MAAAAPARRTEPTVEALPLEEQIRRRAHEHYVERGEKPGSALDDWLQAEQEILALQDEQGTIELAN